MVPKTAFVIGAALAANLGPFAPGAARAATETIVYSFPIDDYNGAGPAGDLLNVDGTLYGTTYYGGAHNSGMLFSLTPQGTETTLYSFGPSSKRHSAPHGNSPCGPLLKRGDSFVGTTTFGGANGGGVAYRLDADGHEHVLHSFDVQGQDGNNDGAWPASGVIDVDGTYYGTTPSGSTNAYFGTIFSLTPQGTETILHVFGSQGDGAAPSSALINLDGTLYGTAPEGGAYGGGIVFSITPQGSYNILYSFGNGRDAFGPQGNLINIGGTLYGVTKGGGRHRAGTVFKITPAGVETVLHSFGRSGDGKKPVAGLLRMGRTLYGTTTEGGADNKGTVFSLALHGKETVLYSFARHNDGTYPNSDLVSIDSVLYGTTLYGGLNGSSGGTVFAITP